MRLVPCLGSRAFPTLRHRAMDSVKMVGKGRETFIVIVTCGDEYTDNPCEYRGYISSERAARPSRQSVPFPSYSPPSSSDIHRHPGGDVSPQRGEIYWP